MTPKFNSFGTDYSVFRNGGGSKQRAPSILYAGGQSTFFGNVQSGLYHIIFAFVCASLIDTLISDQSQISEMKEQIRGTPGGEASVKVGRVMVQVLIQLSLVYMIFYVAPKITERVTLQSYTNVYNVPIMMSVIIPSQPNLLTKILWLRNKLCSSLGLHTFQIGTLSKPSDDTHSMASDSKPDYNEALVSRNTCIQPQLRVDDSVHLIRPVSKEDRTLLSDLFEVA